MIQFEAFHRSTECKRTFEFETLTEAMSSNPGFTRWSRKHS